MSHEKQVIELRQNIEMQKYTREVEWASHISERLLCKNTRIILSWDQWVRGCQEVKYILVKEELSNSLSEIEWIDGPGGSGEIFG